MRRQVVLDTDLGTDIDDSWALAMLLNSPELEPRLILTATANTQYRANVAAKHLTDFGHTDIEIGVGVSYDDPRHKESLLDWLDGFTTADNAGKVYPDGHARLIELAATEEEPTIIAIAPQSNLGHFCRLRPDLVPKCHLISMAGSVNTGHRDAPGKIPEWNVMVDIPASQAVFSAPWKSFTITPLDHCGNLVLTGDNYRRIRESLKSIPVGIISAYKAWLKAYGNEPQLAVSSSILYDTAAIHLACNTQDSIFETHYFNADDAGMLQDCQPNGRPIQCALAWKDKEAYLSHLTDVLLR